MTRLAVVTGAAGDLGSLLCTRFADDGWAVAALDLADPGPIVRALTGRDAVAVGERVDLTDECAVADAFDRLAERFDGVDALVNNAGIFHGVPRVPMWEIDLATWRKVLDSNVTSTFLATRAAIPLLRARAGRVVNLSSSTAAFGMANYLHYVTSKAAIVGMTRAMARELGPSGIAVNAVAPGLVRTPGNVDDLSTEYWAQVADGQCLPESIEPAQIVSAVRTLCEPATGITGQTHVVNNGASMGPF